jgi:hypothetical protein
VTVEMSRREHDALVAEYMRCQLWQFISIDEYLEANVRERIAHGVEGTK